MSKISNGIIMVKSRLRPRYVGLQIPVPFGLGGEGGGGDKNKNDINLKTDIQCINLKNAQQGFRPCINLSSHWPQCLGL